MLYLKDIDDVKRRRKREKKPELQNALAMAEKANEAKQTFIQDEP